MRKPASHQRQTFSSQRYDRAGSAPVIKVRDELDALCDRGSWLIPSPFLASLAQFGDDSMNSGRLNPFRHHGLPGSSAGRDAVR